MSAPWKDELAKDVTALIQYAVVSERILALLKTSRFLSEEVKELAQMDPQMLPELTAAADALSNAASALTRAHGFATARMDTTLT